VAFLSVMHVMDLNQPIKSSTVQMNSLQTEVARSAEEKTICG